MGSPTASSPTDWGASVGALTLTRDPQNGLLTDTTVGSITEHWLYNAFGEATDYTAKYGSTVLYANLILDAAGRVSSKTEEIQGGLFSVRSTFK